MQRRTVTDPVCGLEVDPREAPYMSTYSGRTYYFTDPDCKRMFDEDPEAYVTASSEEQGISGGAMGGSTRGGYS